MEFSDGLGGRLLVDEKKQSIVKKTINPIPISFGNINMYLNLNENSDSIISLFPESEQEIKIYFEDRTPYFVLYTTYDCNLSCDYCFHSKIKKNFQNSIPKYSFEELYSFMKKNNMEDIEIRFFGGEPLLNKEWIYKCVEYFKNKKVKCKYNVFTNGVPFDNKFLDFAVKNNVIFYISVAGHNELQKGVLYRNIVKENIKQLKSRGIKYYGRVVYHPQEISLIELIEEVMDENLKFISVTSEWGNDLDLSIAYKNLVLFCEYYINKIANYQFEYVGIHPFIGYMWKWLINKKYTIEQCGCGRDIYSISLDGKVYPCQCFNEYKEFQCGEIQGEYKEIFKEYNADTLEECKNCNIRYFCKARCYADAYYSHGDIGKFNKTRCAYEKMIVGGSAYILYKLRTEFPRQYKMFYRFLKNYDRYNEH